MRNAELLHAHPEHVEQPEYWRSVEQLLSTVFVPAKTGIRNLRVTTSTLCHMPTWCSKAPAHPPLSILGSK